MQKKKRTLVIAAFPGIGVSEFIESEISEGKSALKILDFRSIKSVTAEQARALKEEIYAYDIVFMDHSPQTLSFLSRLGVNYMVAHPSKECEKEYMSRITIKDFNWSVALAYFEQYRGGHIMLAPGERIKSVFTETGAPKIADKYYAYETSKTKDDFTIEDHRRYLVDALKSQEMDSKYLGPEALKISEQIIEIEKILTERAKLKANTDERKILM